MIIDCEEKKVCMGEVGFFEIIIMMEVFQIGQDMDFGEGLVDGDDMNFVFLFFFKGYVIVLGLLIFMIRIMNFKVNRELDYI